MRSKTERRKVFSYFRAAAGRKANGLAAGVFAIVSVFSLSAFGQKVNDTPLFSVFRPNVGIVTNHADKKYGFAISERGLEAVTGNFDSDGVVDVGTYDRSSRLFMIRRSGDGSTLVLSMPASKGKPVIVTADYDGDKLSDAAVWRNGTWTMLLSSREYAADTAVFGLAGDVPVPADFDGDEKADLAVFRTSENRWYIRSSESGHVRTADFGLAGTDLLVPADYTGDGKADLAAYRNGVWHVIDSETGKEDTFSFGFDDAKPVPGDFDRDGTTDFALYRKGIWYVYDGSRLVSYKFGDGDDVPLSDVPVRQSMAGR